MNYIENLNLASLKILWRKILSRASIYRASWNI